MSVFEKREIVSGEWVMRDGGQMRQSDGEEKRKDGVHLVWGGE